MVEHRLIERMISLLDEESREMSKGQPMRIPFLGDALDFLRFYADRCHHGKEEGILFRDLAGRKLSAEHAEMMKGLVQDHVKARELTAALAQHVRNGPGSCSAAVGTIQALVKLYTGHIRKEDKEFFLPVMQYFAARNKSACWINSGNLIVFSSTSATRSASGCMRMNAKTPVGTIHKSRS